MEINYLQKQEIFFSICDAIFYIPKISRNLLFPENQNFSPKNPLFKDIRFLLTCC